MVPCLKQRHRNRTHPSGSHTAKYEYGPFGEVIRATGPMARANPFLFSTKYYDWETDLYYYGYRYYNPSTGRWLSRDPIEERGGLNLYGFVLNEPIVRIDARGLLCECALSIKLGNVKKWNGTSEISGLKLYAHSFEVSVELQYKKGDGKVGLQWWEKSNLVSAWYGDKVKDNEWADVYALFGGNGASLFSMPNEWDNRDVSTEGTRTVILRDRPQAPAMPNLYRKLQFIIDVYNPPCCCFKPSPDVVTAAQTLSFDSQGEIKDQNFITPDPGKP